MAAPNRYSILRKIANGGMAEIYLARFAGAQGFHKTVVLKRIRTAFIADPQFRNMLLDEAHIAMSLNHGNIVQVLDLGESSGRYFLALELVDGWSLDALLQRSEATGIPLPRELALYIVLQVCRALAYAHSLLRDGKPLGIVHRDISPQNILVSEHGEVKLADFGIAKAMGRREKTAAGVVKGKVYFMSPEQAGAVELDHRSDIFSMGTVLYFLVTKKLAFQAPTPLEALLRIKVADFPSPASVVPSIETELNRIILKSMQLRAEDRYQSADEMLNDVEKVLRTVFAPVGQTELKRWLSALAAKDNAPPISRTELTKDPDDDEEDEAGAWVELGDSSILPPTLPPRKTKANAQPAANPTPRREKAFRTWPLLLGALGLLAAAIWLLGGDFKSIRNHLPRGFETSDSRTAPQLIRLDAGPALLAMPIVVDAGLPQTEMPAPSEAPAIEPAEPAELLAGVDAGLLEGTTASEAEEANLLEQAVPNPESMVMGEEAAAVPPVPTPAAAPAPVVKKPAAGSPRPVATAPIKPEPAPVKKPLKNETVSVSIQSVPSEAVVKLGTRVFGKTPINLRFRPEITFELTFVKSGYVTTSKRFLVQDRTGQKVTTFLKKAPTKRTR